MERGLRVHGGGEVLHHAPCHDSLDGRAAEVVGGAGGTSLRVVPHCCSEAGTLAPSRPDIADAMLDRKRRALSAALAGREGAPCSPTAPPASTAWAGVRPRWRAPPNLSVYLAERPDGPAWPERLRELTARAEAVSF